MKASVRIGGKVTSLQVRSSVLAMYYILTGEGKDPHQHSLEVINAIVEKWKGSDARGLSSFITDAILEQMLEREDLPLYRNVYDRLEGL